MNHNADAKKLLLLSCWLVGVAMTKTKRKEIKKELDLGHGTVVLPVCGNFAKSSSFSLDVGCQQILRCKIMKILSKQDSWCKESVTNGFVHKSTSTQKCQPQNYLTNF